MKLALKGSGERPLIFTKWAIFAVSLPLLPIVSKLFAEWMDEGTPNWSASNLFGDGELLVLATVIAAAGIGDLVFDMRELDVRRTFREATAIALALVCVVVSVTLYALVTLKREQLTPGQQAVADSVKPQEAAVVSQQENVRLLVTNLAAAQKAADAALLEYHREITGANGQPPGDGPLAKALLDRYRDASAVARSLQGQLQQAEARLTSAQKTLAGTRDSVNQKLTSNRTFSETRSAYASIYVFLFGLAVGANCVMTGTTRRRLSVVDTSLPPPSVDAPVGVAQANGSRAPHRDGIQAADCKGHA